MLARPEPKEAAPYYFTYIDKVPEGNILDLLHSQTEATLELLTGISEEKSLHRYAIGGS